MCSGTAGTTEQNANRKKINRLAFFIFIAYMVFYKNIYLMYCRLKICNKWAYFWENNIRSPKDCYDTYEYLKSLGIEEI